MNQRTLIFSVLWVLTLAISYLIGTRGPSATESDPSANSSASRSQASDRQDLASNSAASRRALRPSERLAKDLSPTQAVVELAQLTDPLERSRGFLALIDKLGPEEFLDVVAEFRALGITNERMAEYQLLLSAWAKADPYAALDYATESTGGDFAKNTILAAWAKNDLSAALAWAESKHEGDNANPFMVGIIKGIADLDPSKAAQLTETLPFSRQRGQALRSTIAAMMQEDPAGAKEWATALEDEQLQVGAISYVADSMSRTDALAAAEWLSSVENIDAQKRAAEDIGERLASQDLDSAKTWAETLAPEALDEAASGIVDRMVENDPIAAAEWLSTLAGKNVNLDSAIGELIRGSSRNDDPYLAATWVSGLSSARDQERYYHRVLGPWLESDPSAAREFIQNNELPQSIQNRFGDR